MPNGQQVHQMARRCYRVQDQVVAMQILARAIGYRPPTGTLLDATKQKTPDESTNWGSSWNRMGRLETSLGPCHMWSIITCPKPEHETCVAPSIRRAKS